MYTTKQQTNDRALLAYIAAQQEAHALLERLTADLDAHQDALDPEDIHYGHVGDITRIIADLKDILGDEA